MVYYIYLIENNNEKLVQKYLFKVNLFYRSVVFLKVSSAKRRICKKAFINLYFIYKYIFKEYI